MINSLWISCGLISSLAVSSAALARSYDDIIESKQITVAIYRDFAPFSYLVDGLPKGIDIDVAQSIAKQLNVELKLRWMTADENVEDDLRNNLWKGHFLKRSVADLMLRVPYDRAYSQMRDDIGELVHGQVHMFAPYHTESWQIIYNADQIESVTTIAVFQYHNIGVEVDSIPQFYLTSAFAGRMRDSAKHFSSIPLALDAMNSGEVDAAMGLRSQISHFQQTLDSKKYPLAENAFPMLGRQQWDIGMAVKSQYRQLGYAVGDIVENMIKQGDMENIFTKYHAIYQIPELYLPTETHP
ncbi:ABC transporter substrate-binding protein [Shewanella sp. D64]|uniref:substrate-binding periplasmic protein n=1 Tax=unclassified Shewanella TaxID=196818 RepID=UPI0022BA3BB2|nr:MULTISPECIES: transporter substrate-binding domain-containing protein [unclassified Shewanella]MEC4724145.1 ABC transporter substrate-binding protein [Shewanella sp. D64]MEC4736165.1 ABC transporter substrate-binding protein [Shewanella sp. E94]WBJ98168.1 ABC transporter substrate-binding protein [Shewanella sp. MTB7]